MCSLHFSVFFEYFPLFSEATVLNFVCSQLSEFSERPMKNWFTVPMATATQKKSFKHLFQKSETTPSSIFIIFIIRIFILGKLEFHKYFFAHISRIIFPNIFQHFALAFLLLFKSAEYPRAEYG